MDAQGWIALGGLVFVLASGMVSIAVFSSRTRTAVDAAAANLEKADHKLRNFDNWRLNILPRELNENFARRGEMTAELKAIHDSLARIEANQARHDARIMNGAAGV